MVVVEVVGFHLISVGKGRSLEKEKWKGSKRGNGDIYVGVVEEKS